MAVVPMREGGLIPATVMEPDEDLIAKLEQLLADARSGHLRALGYSMIDRDRAVTTGWSGHADHHDMTAGVHTLAYRYMRAGEDRGDYDGPGAA